MAKGKAKYQARLDAIQLLGKDLARRAKRRCEFCESKDDLRPYDATPEDEPSLDGLALLCGRCRAVLDGRGDDPQTLRFLEVAVWSDIPAIGNSAKALLRRLDAAWARDTLELVGDI